MKQIDKMSRLTGKLEKAFRLLNTEFFDGELPNPIITVIPTSRAYAHYVPSGIWATKDDAKREINIASGTLDRPLENILASLVHEMVHMFCDCVLNEQDTSNKGVYHNKIFKREAESHGLIVTRSEKYGYSHTEPADRLLEFVLDHDELREIEICCTTPTEANLKSHHRKYICPYCGNSVRATKAVHIACLDCNAQMILNSDKVGLRISDAIKELDGTDYSNDVPMENMTFQLDEDEAIDLDAYFYELTGEKF